MNWIDLLVVAYILFTALIGLSRGFIYSVFTVATFFISAIVSVKFYPLVSDILVKTALYTNIKASILKNLLMQQQSQTPALDNQAKQAAANALVENLHLPPFLKNLIITRLPDPSKIIPINSIMDSISDVLAKAVIDVISLFLLYMIIRTVLFFLKFILQGVAKLPVFKQANKLGGLALGTAEGFLSLQVLFALAMLFHALPIFKGFIAATDSSAIAKFFYQHNFIINWMFPK